jgi:hypothetical protein
MCMDVYACLWMCMDVYENVCVCVCVCVCMCVGFGHLYVGMPVGV